MFQNAAVDVAIGLILMYLVLSLLCTVVNEFVATKLDLRAKSLAAGLKELLDDPVVRNAFYDQGLIAGTQKALANTEKILTQSAPAVTTAAAAAPADASTVAAAPGVEPARAPALAGAAAAPVVVSAPASARVSDTQPGNHPSYISANTFALSLMGALTGTRLAKGQPTPSFADVQAAIEVLPPSKIKSALQASLLTAQGDFSAFRQSVTTWFDDSMDRLSGAYKRHLKLISIVVGCVIAVIMNADTFTVSHALWSDSGLRAQVVQVADKVAKDETNKGSAAGSPGQAAPDLGAAWKKAVQTLSPLPIGWPAPNQPAPDDVKQWFSFLFPAKVLGWFATGIALSFGAPFWFDLLSKFINVRAAGVKPDRQDAKKAN